MNSPHAKAASVFHRQSATPQLSKLSRQSSPFDLEKHMRLQIDSGKGLEQD